MTRLLLQLTFIVILAPCASCTSTSSTNREATVGQDSAAISSATLKSILGKSLDSREVAGYFSRFSRPPEVTGPYFDGSVYYSWKENGISVMLEAGKVKAIILYAGNSEGFSQYKGEIPNGLMFSETRESVEKRLGIPKASGGNGVIPFWVSYPNIGVAITYDTLNPNDLSTTIRHIAYQQPKGI